MGSASHESGPTVTAKNILVVEDVAETPLSALCERSGLTVHVCRSIEDALVTGPKLANILGAILLGFNRPGESVLAVAHLLGDSRLRHLAVVAVVPSWATGLAIQLRQMGTLVCCRETLDESLLKGLLEESRKWRVSIPPNETLGRLVTAAQSYAVADPTGAGPATDLETSWGSLLRRASFRIQTPAEAQALAGVLASVCSDPVRRMLGLEELLLNAIEHGNLGFDGPTKQRLLVEGTWSTEVARRLTDPSQRKKFVSIDYATGPDGIAVTIRDQGKGFDFHKIVDAGAVDPALAHGRGLALARQLSFDAIEFVDPGNVVIARIKPAPDRPIQHSLAPARDTGGEMSARELREQLEVELARARSRVEAASFAMRRFFELSEDLMLIVEAGVISQANPTFLRLLGYRPEDLVGTSMLELVHEDDRTRMLAELGDEAFSSSQGRKREPVLARTRAHNGKHLRVEWSIATTVEGKGYAVGRDVSELKSAFEALKAQSEAAELARRRMESEQVLAGRVLANVRRAGCLDERGFRYSLSPLDFFNGDIALAARTPLGEMRWILGDFTGHGLGAAVGTIPIASVFYATARKNVPIEEALRTLNEQLRGLLPPGLFCCAAVFCLSADRRELRIWNGGMPPVVIVTALDGGLRTFPSTHLALSIADDRAFDSDCECVPVSVGDEIVAFTDGLTEAGSPTGELFGQERLERALRESQPGYRFEGLMRSHAAFRGGTQANDDVSLVTYCVYDPAEPRKTAVPTAAATGAATEPR